MSRRTISVTDPIQDYILDVSLREHPALLQLREATARLDEADMQISPEQGQFMSLLVRLIGAKRALEVGVFTGYSALAVALSLPQDGTLVACDVSEEWTSIGKKHWQDAGVDARIDLRLGPAVETLEALVRSGAAGTFDFAFIDADKLNYDRYYELCLMLVRAEGLLVIDNVLWDGKVVDAAVDDEETEAIRRLNKKIHADERVDHSLIPVADGLTLARKRNTAM